MHSVPKEIFQSPDFKLLRQDKKTKARRGKLSLAHGIVETPVFMPVGTYGAIRGCSASEINETGASIILNNTFHMVCRPGVELIEKAGGLHKFQTWNKPILTDSGGFQVFSLAQHRKVKEEGVEFKDPLSGAPHFFTPENVVGFQEKFGSDIMMVLDECPAGDASAELALAAVERTTRWAKRAKQAQTRRELAMFPIFQGCCDLELREKSLREILALERGEEPWPGIAIGGLSVGESKKDFVKTVHGIRHFLPTDRPRYLMGVGTPRDLVFAVACGVDMFDCVIPSRNARHGIVMTSQGRVNLMNQKYREDFSPLDESLDYSPSRDYSKSYLRHLFQIGESLGQRLATLHNVRYFVGLMEEVRRQIDEGHFYEWAMEFLHNPATQYLGRDNEIDGFPREF